MVLTQLCWYNGLEKKHMVCWKESGSQQQLRLHFLWSLALHHLFRHSSAVIAPTVHNLKTYRFWAVMSVHKVEQRHETGEWGGTIRWHLKGKLTENFWAPFVQEVLSSGAPTRPVCVCTDCTLAHCHSGREHARSPLLSADRAVNHDDGGLGCVLRGISPAILMPFHWS